MNGLIESISPLMDRRVRITANSCYHGRTGTVVRFNREPDNWMVAIDGDEELDEVSFDSWEFEVIND